MLWMHQVTIAKLRCVLANAVDSRLPRLWGQCVDIGPVGLDISRHRADVPGYGRIIKVPPPTHMTMHHKEFTEGERSDIAFTGHR
jgi:hypothetical protein